MVKNLPAMPETQVWSLGGEDPLEKEMATHSSIFAWRIPKDIRDWQATVHGVTKSWTQLNNLHLQEISCPPGNKIKKTLCCYKLTFFFLSQREILFTAHEFTKYLRQKISKRSSLSTDKSWKQTPTGQCDTEVKKWFDTYLNYFIKMYLNTP